MNTQEWHERYSTVVANPPKEGDILTTLSGAPAKLNIDLNPGTPPFIYGRTFVPEIISDDVRWCLQETDSKSYHGFKCVLMPRARTELLRKIKFTGETTEVMSLRVVHLSRTGKSLLCEVAEYVPEEVENDTETSS